VTLTSSGIEGLFVTVKHVHQCTTALLRPSRFSYEVAAEQRDLAESIAELHQIADGNEAVLSEAAGINVDSWYAWPSAPTGL
jgi:hypothetical protein